MMTAWAPDLPSDLRATAPIYFAKLLAGLVDLARAGSAGPDGGQCMIRAGCSVASGCMLLGMRLCALELCSVY